MPSIVEIGSDEVVDFHLHDDPSTQAAAPQGPQDASAGGSWVRASQQKRRIHISQKSYSAARIKQLQKRMPELPAGVTALGLAAGVKWYQNHFTSKSLTDAGGAYY